MRLRNTLLVSVGLILAGLIATPAMAKQVVGEMLLYQKHEQGLPPYPSRIIVTNDMMRLDDGVDQGDYAVYDRKARIIYSVSHSDRTVLEIPWRPVDVESPVELNLSEEPVATGKDAPKVAGRHAEHHRLLSGQKICYNVVSVPGLLRNTVAALKEFREVLAGEHAATLPYVPADMHEPCDLAMNIFNSGWLLKYGVPIQEWDGNGNAKALKDFDTSYPVDTALFELPEGYHHYRINDDQ